MVAASSPWVQPGAPPCRTTGPAQRRHLGFLGPRVTTGRHPSTPFPGLWGVSSMPIAQACPGNGMSGELTFASPSSQHSGMCWGYHQCLAPGGGQAGMWPESQSSWEGTGGYENGQDGFWKLPLGRGRPAKACLYSKENAESLVRGGGRGWGRVGSHYDCPSLARYKRSWHLLTTPAGTFLSITSTL